MKDPISSFAFIYYRQSLMVVSLADDKADISFNGNPFPGWEILPKEFFLDNFLEKLSVQAKVPKNIMRFFIDISIKKHAIVKITENGVTTSLNDSLFIQYDRTYQQNENSSQLFSVGTSNPSITKLLLQRNQKEQKNLSIHFFRHVDLDVLSAIIF